MTQLRSAKDNRLTFLMKAVAKEEGLAAGIVLKRIKEGKVVIPANRLRRLIRPCGIGYGLRTKVNANIGTSTDRTSLKLEMKKLKTAVRFGADTIMDLSVGGNLKLIRSLILWHSPLPVGTVPIYEIAVEAKRRRGDYLKFSADDVLEHLKSQAEEGVDFFTIHAGVTKKNFSLATGNKRTLGIVSRGGAILVSWMRRHKKENPFLEHFERILDIAYEYDVTLSLGDGLRPGSVLDATDKAQISELKTLGKLARQARQKNVQVMIEGPGHIPLDQIKKNVDLEKRICADAPFYVLGPLVTDIAPGYDHITSAIGSSLAASLGADFLCYVTPSEHLRHPSVEDVREGVVSSRIAAHAADLVKLKKRASCWDKDISSARRKRDWQKQIKLAIDPEKARQYRLSSGLDRSDVCSMCGDYCSIKIMDPSAKDSPGQAR